LFLIKKKQQNRSLVHITHAIFKSLLRMKFSIPKLLKVLQEKDTNIPNNYTKTK